MKIAHYAQLAMEKLVSEPFDDETAVEYLRAGKPVRLADDKTFAVLAFIGGAELSRFITEVYDIGTYVDTLPVTNQFLVVYPSGNLCFVSRFPSAYGGWVCASDKEVRDAIDRSSAQSLAPYLTPPSEAVNA